MKKPKIQDIYVLKNDFTVYIADNICTCYTNAGLKLEKGTEILVVNRTGEMTVFSVLDTDYVCWVYEKDFYDNFMEKSEEKEIEKYKPLKRYLGNGAYVVTNPKVTSIYVLYACVKADIVLMPYVEVIALEDNDSKVKYREIIDVDMVGETKTIDKRDFCDLFLEVTDNEETD